MQSHLSDLDSLISQASSSRPGNGAANGYRPYGQQPAPAPAPLSYAAFSTPLPVFETGYHSAGGSYGYSGGPGLYPASSPYSPTGPGDG